MGTYKIVSYFINDYHNWNHLELSGATLSEANEWMKNEITKLKGWGKEIEVKNDAVFHRITRNSSKEVVIANTYIFEIIQEN